MKRARNHAHEKRVRQGEGGGKAKRKTVFKFIPFFAL